MNFLKDIADIFLIIIILFFSHHIVSYAATEQCPTELGKEASKNSDAIDSWGVYYESYQKYKVCDDGEIGTNFSISLRDLFIKYWEKTSELSKLLKEKEDDDFEKFVLEHLDLVISARELDTIYNNAKNHCSPNNHEICQEIIERLYDIEVEALLIKAEELLPPCADMSVQRLDTCTIKISCASANNEPLLGFFASRCQ